nr:retrovirus-related Pol polyprotein from transposon TNT 1-94 [Tanacetum cinerariifolium]
MYCDNKSAIALCCNNVQHSRSKHIDIRTMDMTIDQQVALDNALVPHASRLRIGKSNFHLRLDITEMLHICPRLHNQTFDELPFEEEILAFLRYLGHSGEIKKIIDTSKTLLLAAYKEYYAIASGAAPPETKVSMRKTKSSSNTTMPPPMAAGTRLSTSAKGKQPAKSTKAKGLSVLSEVEMSEAEQIKLATKRSMQQTHIS